MNRGCVACGCQLIPLSGSAQRKTITKGQFWLVISVVKKRNFWVNLRVLIKRQFWVVIRVVKKGSDLGGC